MLYFYDKLKTNNPSFRKRDTLWQSLGHTEWSKSDREWQISYDIAYMWNLKKWYKWTYLQNRSRVTDVENKLMVTKGEMGGGINWEIGIDIYTLLYIEQIPNKNLPYSTGNPTQYSVMTYMGIESKQEWIHAYV